MKTSIQLLLILLISFCSVTALANPVQLSFALDPAETIPGIPVTFRVRAINTSTTLAMFPRRVLLQMRIGASWKTVCGDDASEHARCSMYFPAMKAEGPPSIELAPGEERVLDYLAGPNSPPWLDHRELLFPGSYRLRLVTLPDDWREESITSNEVVLIVQVPTGPDAGAWELISGSTHIMPQRSRFADQLWSLYPDSVYTSITPRGTTAEDWIGRIDLLNEALAKHPPSGYADLFKFRIASAHLHIRYTSLGELNVQKAYQHNEAARVLLDELLGKDTEAELKAEAAELARSVMTLEEIEAQIDERRPGYVPRPDCVREQVKLVRNALADLLKNASSKAKKALADAIADLDKFDAMVSKTPPDMHAALASIDQATNRLETAAKNEWVAPADGKKMLVELTWTASDTARSAIAAAASDPEVKTNHLELANRKYEEAEKAVQAGDYGKAVSRYREALQKAQTASQRRGRFC